MHQLVTGRIVLQYVFQIDVKPHILLEQMILDNLAELIKTGLNHGQVAAAVVSADGIVNIQQQAMILLEGLYQPGIVMNARPGGAGRADGCCRDGALVGHRGMRESNFFLGTENQIKKEHNAFPKTKSQNS